MTSLTYVYFKSLTGKRNHGMRRELALQVLSSHMAEIRRKFDVESLALFGSVARDQAGPESDLDILVAFSRTPGLFGFLDLKEYLENLLHRPVDLVTHNAIKKQLRSRILQEAVRVH
jgi:predicted nucleotidyltransferase